MALSFSISNLVRIQSYNLLVYGFKTSRFFPQRTFSKEFIKKKKRSDWTPFLLSISLVWIRYKEWEDPGFKKRSGAQVLPVLKYCMDALLKHLRIDRQYMLSGHQILTECAGARLWISCADPVMVAGKILILGEQDESLYLHNIPENQISSQFPPFPAPSVSQLSDETTITWQPGVTICVQCCPLGNLIRGSVTKVLLRADHRDHLCLEPANISGSQEESGHLA